MASALYVAIGLFRSPDQPAYISHRKSAERL
jgi:hypothetical protein